MTVNERGPMAPASETPAALLRRAADASLEPTTGWVQELPEGAPEALASWLRAEADKADGPIARDIAAGRVRIDMPTTQPSPALVFAWALLGEEETP